MSADPVGQAFAFGGAAIAALGLVLALLGAVGVLGWGVAPLVGLLWPPIGLAIGALGRRASGDRVRGDALAVRGAMNCHLLALSIAVALAGGWFLVGVPGTPLPVLAWGVAAVGYAGFAYVWDLATPTNVDAVENLVRS